MEIRKGIEELKRQREALRGRSGIDPTVNVEIVHLDLSISTLGNAAKILRIIPNKRTNPRRGTIDPESNIGRTIAVLKAAGRPLHIDRIVELLNAEAGDRKPVKRSGLSPRLAKLAKRREVFEQVDQATYWLVGVELKVEPPTSETLVEFRKAREDIKKGRPKM